MLDRVLRDLPGVCGGAAGDDDDLVHGLEHVLVDVHLVERQAALGVEAAEQRIGHGLRLIVDLLVHEGREAALLRRGGVPVDLELLTLDEVALRIRDRDLVRRDRHDLVLADLDGCAGVVDECGDVGAEEVLAFAEADDQRRVPAGGDDLTGSIGVNREQGERAFELIGGLAHRGGEVAGFLIVLGQLGGGHLGVGLGEELDALGDEVLLQVGEVLDDPVVDECELATVGQVRVGVDVGGSTVGGPAGVADSGLRGWQRVGFDLLGQGGELSGLLRRGELTVGRHERDTGRVVAAVLEPLQAAEHDIERRVIGIVNGGLGYITNDSTHEGDFTCSQPISCISASHDRVNVTNCTRTRGGGAASARVRALPDLGRAADMTHDTMGE